MVVVVIYLSERNHSEGFMVKIDRNKIVKAAVGSARLEGYKGSPKASSGNGKVSARPEAKTKTTAKR
jgi:hypothetical protein